MVLKGVRLIGVATRFAMSSAALVALLAPGIGCRREPQVLGAKAPVARSISPAVSPLSNPLAPSVNEPSPTDIEQAEPDPRPLRRCFASLPAWVDSPVSDLLDRADDNLRRSDFDSALACAEEAARQMPRSIEAHHDRATALMRLGRLDEARDAVAMALSIAPNDGETLDLAADLYVNHLAPTAERAAIGLEYARRGSRNISHRDRARASHLALLEGQSLIDLGRSAEALRSINVALKYNPLDAAARYEKGVALFELCRFDDAARAFERVLDVEPDHAHATYHLALIHERGGDDERASARFTDATRSDPKSFPPAPDVSSAEFAERVSAVRARLNPDIQADLADIQVEAVDLPSVEDLTAEMPPLSPTILGLYRGLPLGREDLHEATTPAARGSRARQGRVAAGPPPSGGPATCAVSERAIVLYRRNILRSIQSIADLDRAIERTLLHEVGHLRGEDDGSLRDRGLE
jgi:tetratricopeptide (TPR) repeat protein